MTVFGFRNSKIKNKFDVYNTPSVAIEELLKKEKFVGNVFEPASGSGNLSRVIKKYNKCYSSDIRKSKEIYGRRGIDFLKMSKKMDNIITNPPFRWAKEFLEKSKEISRRKIALFLRINFLEGISRYNVFKDKEFPLKVIYVFSKRVRFYDGRVKRERGMVSYCWFVWDKKYKGKPYVDWILYEKKK